MRPLFAFACVLLMISYVLLMISLFIVFPTLLWIQIGGILLFIGYLKFFGWTIPYDTDLWKGGAGY